MPEICTGIKGSVVNFVGGRSAEKVYKRGDIWVGFWRVKGNSWRTQGKYPGRPRV